jgi:hypothetical protein
VPKKLSTILKALKRIDHTTPPPEDQQSRPLRIDPKETLKARVYKIRFYRKLYLSLILLVAVIAAGWFVYDQKSLFISELPSGRNSKKVPIYQAKIDPNPSQAEDSAQKRTPSPGRQNIRIGTSDEQDPAGAKISSKPFPQMPAQQKSQKKPIFIAPDKNKPLAQPSTAKPKISQSQTPGSQKTVQRNAVQSTAASTGKTQSVPRQPQVPRTYQRLDDDKLKLQAIAWSHETEQRIAVINGHVVREGETVEGFSINQIRQEDVIVNDGTESWQLEFSLK